LGVLCAARDEELVVVYSEHPWAPQGSHVVLINNQPAEEFLAAFGDRFCNKTHSPFLKRRLAGFLWCFKNDLMPVSSFVVQRHDGLFEMAPFWEPAEEVPLRSLAEL